MKAFSHPRHQGKYLVVHVAPDRIEWFRVRIDGEKKIGISDFRTGAAIGDIRPRRGEEMLLSFDSRCATTIILTGSTPRSDADVPLGESLLETAVAETVSRLFAQSRAVAAAHLNLGEFDVIPLTSRVRGFRVDGHKIINPVGYRGGRIEIQVELTFASRTHGARIPEEWFRGSAFVTEEARAELAALERVHEMPLHLIRSTPDGSVAFSLTSIHGETSLLRRDLVWAARELLRALAHALGVGPSAARDVYRLMVTRQLSAGAQEYFETVLAPHLEGLFHEVRRAQLGGVVYLDADIPLPLALPHYGRGFNLRELPLEALLEKTGFSYDGQSVALPTRFVFRYLAPFFEYYFDDTDPRANRWVRRRVAWLHGRESER